MNAGEVMTRQVVTVRAETSLAAAAALMVESRVSGLPVVDERQHLVGILTEGDLLHRVETGTGHKHRYWLFERLLSPGREAVDYVETHSRVVADLMTSKPIAVTETTALQEVVDLMEANRVRRLPVLREGVLVGVVSRADLVRALSRQLAEATVLDRSDAEIEAVIRDEIAAHDWGNATQVTVSSDKGVVTLDGLIFDERARIALRVAAQNAAGVTAVVDKLVWLEPTSGLCVPAM